MCLCLCVHVCVCVFVCVVCALLTTAAAVGPSMREAIRTQLREPGDKRRKAKIAARKKRRGEVSKEMRSEKRGRGAAAGAVTSPKSAAGAQLTHSAGTHTTQHCTYTYTVQ